MRRRLIEHCLDPGALVRELERASQRTQSPFEKQVLERLFNRGYRVRPQLTVGRYRIDLVVGEPGNRLAIECDGDRYHPLEKLPEDMERQATLERLGWRFLRLRGSAFFRDPEATMEQVFSRLEELGIPPEGIEREVPETADPVDDLVEQLGRRAAEIRADWQTSQGREGGPDAVQPRQESSGEDQAVLWGFDADQQVPRSTPDSDSGAPCERQNDVPANQESLKPSREVGAARDRTWQDMFAALKAYKDKHGDCNVPPDWPEDPQLAQWVAEQRRSWAEGTLDGERFRELALLGFRFRA